MGSIMKTSKGTDDEDMIDHDGKSADWVNCDGGI